MVPFLQVCTVLNSTQMTCPTPALYKYLPPEYLDKLNDDYTEIVNPDENGQRKKRSSTGPDSTLLGLFQYYVSTLLLETTGNILLFDYEFYILKIFHILDHFCVTTWPL